MNVLNHHSRTMPVSIAEVGKVLDTLASPDDRLWPSHAWPAMRFDRPLQVGASGGHGPVRYVVESYVPGQAVTFRFAAPRGFLGTHAFSVTPCAGGTVLSHTISMQALGIGALSWALVFRPLHDALLEDALTKAEQSLTGRGTPIAWSVYVRILRFFLRRRSRRSP